VSAPDIEENAGQIDEPLARTVARLRAERDGLRRAMQSRALIEQAKGVLMSRHRITADEAFARLVETSQHSNVKLAQVAAGVVASVSPLPGGAADPRDGRAPQTVPRAVASPVDGAGPVTASENGPARPMKSSDVRDGSATASEERQHTRHLLTVVRLRAAESYDDIVEALAQTDPAPLSVVLLLCEPDQSLCLVASRGLTRDVASQWTRIPPQVHVPLTDAVRTGRPVWLPDPEAARRTYPLIAAIGSRSGSTAALPMVAAGRIVGVIGMTWPGTGMGGWGNQAFLAALGEVCGPVATRIANSTELPGPGDAWLCPLLDATRDSAALLAPMRVGDRIVDFAFEYLNERAAAEVERHGFERGRHLLLTEVPGPGAELLLPLYRDVLSDGEPRQLTDVVIPALRPGAAAVSLLLRAVRLGDRVVASWRTRSPGELLYDDFVVSEGIAGVASFRWRPAAGQWLASPGLSTLLGWPERGGPPLSPATAGRVLAEGHWAALRRAAVAALRGGHPPTITVATHRGRWLRVTITPLPERDGLRGTVQDVSELRATLTRQHGQLVARAGSRR
jgi:hypothetical protein